MSNNLLLSKPTILYLLDSLGMGGAENLLVNILNATASEYNNILVYLGGPHTLKPKITGAQVICIQAAGKANIPMAILKLRRIIKQQHVDIVTAHSYWTSIISRLATPKTVRLINTYHFADYETFRHTVSCQRMIWLDKRTHSKRLQIVTVSAYVQGILERECGYAQNIQTITNFVSNDYKIASTAGRREIWEPGKPLRLVATGSIKPEKNYELLLDAFGKLKEEPIYADIYGGGEALENFRNRAATAGITNLVFKGPSSSLPTVLPQYDAYIMSSFSEACPLSPIEALSCSLPLILSDIPPLQEIAGEEALYFESRNAASLVSLLKALLAGKVILKYDSYFAATRLAHYSQVNCLAALHQLYTSIAPVRTHPPIVKP